jgi:hypothetical protein
MYLSFAENRPKTMRRLLADQGYRIVKEDTETRRHFSIAIFKLKS